MRKVIISSMIGNALEWYDFALYGHFVAIIGRLFFPSSDPIVQLIAAFGVFAAGFFMRPLGAALFGYLGDRYGRRNALAASIMLMAVPTACIGILPGYAQIGVLAPVLLTVIRLLQGLSLGGAFSGSIAFVVEHAPHDKRGVAGSTTMISMNLGILAGIITGFFFSSLMSVESFELYGWRIPFLLGFFVGFIGLYIKKALHESPEYEQAKAAGDIHKAPVRSVFVDHFSTLLKGINVYIMVTVPFYTLVIFLKTYMTEFVGISFAEASLMSTIALLFCTMIMPLSGSLSDKIGRKPILVMTTIAFIMLTYPCFYLMHQPGFIAPLAGHLLFAGMVGCYMGPIPAVLAELYPTSVRFTGVALSYNLCAALLGGPVPAIASWLIGYTGDSYAIAYYVIGFAMLALFGLNFYQDRYALRFAQAREENA